MAYLTKTCVIVGSVIWNYFQFRNGKKYPIPVLTT